MRGVEQVPWVYDAVMTLIEATGLGRWRAWLVRDARGRVLDLGCGTGRNLVRLPGVAAFGVDPCRETLARARRRAPGAHVVCGRAEQLPFRDGVFDTVLSGLVLCSVEQPGAALAELRRVLAQGGTVRVLEHVRSTHPGQARLQDLAQPLWTRFSGGCRPNRDTEAAVAGAGFLTDSGSRRARGSMRRFVARPQSAGLFVRTRPG